MVKDKKGFLGERKVWTTDSNATLEVKLVLVGVLVDVSISFCWLNYISVIVVH